MGSPQVTTAQESSWGRGLTAPWVWEAHRSSGWEAAATDPQHPFPHAQQVEAQHVINLGQSKSKARVPGTCRSSAGSLSPADMAGTGATEHSPSPAHTDDAVLLLGIRAQSWGALPQADLTP